MGSKNLAISARLCALCVPDPQNLEPAMDGDDAAGQVVHITALEAGIFHHPLERFLVRVHADRLGQVAVAIGILGHQFAHLRQELEGVQVVGFLQRLVPRLGKLQYQGPAAGLRSPVHGAQRLGLVGHVAQAESDADQVKAVVETGRASASTWA